MRNYFLDIVEAGISRSFDWTLVIVITATILVEAVVMLLMRYNPFKKTLPDSLLVNAVSLGAGYVMIEFTGTLFNNKIVPNLLLLCALTIVIEGGYYTC